MLQYSNTLNNGLDILDREVISFHYVSEFESQLLYKVLTKKFTPSVHELEQIWPKENRDVGPYAHRLTNYEDAKLLHEYLVNRFNFSNC